MSILDRLLGRPNEELPEGSKSMLAEVESIQDSSQRLKRLLGDDFCRHRGVECPPGWEDLMLTPQERADWDRTHGAD